MKKLCLLIVAICLMTFNAMQAQPIIKKGSLTTGMTSSISLGGGWGSEFLSVGFLKSGDDYKERILNLMPSAGIALMDNLVIRAQFAASSYTETSDLDDSEWHRCWWGVGPYVTYYYPLGSVALMADGGIMIGKEKDKYVYTGSEFIDNYNAFIMEFFGGVAKNINEHVQLNVLGGYTRASWKYVDGGEESEADVCQGLVVKVGFTIILPVGLF